jgi:hypothetical protein
MNVDYTIKSADVNNLVICVKSLFKEEVSVYLKFIQLYSLPKKYSLCLCEPDFEIVAVWPNGAETLVKGHYKSKFVMTAGLLLRFIDACKIDVIDIEEVDLCPPLPDVL